MRLFTRRLDQPNQPTTTGSYIVFYIRLTIHLHLSAETVSHALRARARDRVTNRQNSALGLALLDFRQRIDNARQETDSDGL